jgi:tRNA1Val (adenine37-N6)-methyltransferase
MTKTETSTIFRFKKFSIAQDQCAMKVGTDGILLAAWAKVEEVQRILDIGTGTGLIALMLAQRQAQAKVVGIEIDQAAAKQAQTNAVESPFASRVEIIQGSIQDYTHTAAEPFDLIISNPPFFSGGVLSENAGRAEVRHTVKLSHHDLLRSVQVLLNPAGRFCLILPLLEGLRFQELAQTYQLYTQHICKVAPRPGKPANRLLLELGKSKVSDPQTTSLTIYADTDGTTRSHEFTSLTADFYL